MGTNETERVENSGWGEGMIMNISKTLQLTDNNVIVNLILYAD